MLLGSCKPAFGSDPSVPLSKPIDYGSLPERIRSDAPQPASVFEIHGMGIRCEEPPEAFWSFSGARHTFSTPPISIVAQGPIQTDLRSNDPDRGTENGPFCGLVDLGYKRGVTVDTQSPTSVKDPEQTLGDLSLGPGLVWGECPELHPAAVGAIFWEQPSVTVQLTDVRQADKYNQELFLGGVLAGVLGALVIECLGSGFEVAETSSTKRKASRHGGPSWFGRLWRRVRRLPPWKPPAHKEDEPPRWEPDERSYLQSGVSVHCPTAGAT